MNDKFHYELKSNGYTMSLETDTPITDITFQTDAAAYWRFYDETRQQIYDLEKKRDLYAKAYLMELRKSDIPYFLMSRFLADITPETPKDKDKARSRDFSIHTLIENLFSDKFRKNHKIKFSGICQEGLEARTYMVSFDIGKYEYRLVCPQPQNMKESHFCGNGLCQSDQMYTAHWTEVSSRDSGGRHYRLCGRASYDWKPCMVAIEHQVGEFEKREKKHGNA